MHFAHRPYRTAVTLDSNLALNLETLKLFPIRIKELLQTKQNKNQKQKQTNKQTNTKQSKLKQNKTKQNKTKTKQNKTKAYTIQVAFLWEFVSVEGVCV